MAFLTNYLGLSLALGSFIAGLIISESRYSHQVVADILPFKESFNSIFFISVGMLLNVNFAMTHIPNVLMFGAGIFLLKALVILIDTVPEIPVQGCGYISHGTRTGG